MSDWRDELDDVFDLKSGAKNDTCCHSYLVSPSITVDLAVTINLPPKCKEYKSLSLLEKINVYKELWNTICVEYNALQSHYVVEYCKSGEPHIHGTIKMQLHSNVCSYDSIEICRMVAKSIFLKLPRSAFKQFGKAKLNSYFNIFDSPAVYIKMPQILSQGWEEYKQKNAL